MAASTCSHARRMTGTFQTDLSRNTDGCSLYTIQISASICGDCGRIIDLYCQSPATVCAWLEKELQPPLPPFPRS